MRIHHATAAKAEKLGFTLSLVENNENVVSIRWAERNKHFTHTDPTQAVEDMSVLRMLTLEYPKLRAVLTLDPALWIVYEGKRAIGKGATLKAAWNAALDVLEGTALETGFGEELDEDDDGEGKVEGEEAEGTEEGEEADEDAGRSVVKRVYKTRYKPHRAKCGDELSVLITKHLQLAEKDEDGRVRLDEARIERFARANGVWQDSYQFLNVGMRRMNIANRLRAKVKKEYEIVWAK